MSQLINPESIVYGLELRLDKSITGVQKAFPPAATHVFLRGTPYTQSELVAKGKEVVAPWKAVRDAKAIIREFAANKKTHIANARRYLGDLEVGVTAFTGDDSEDLTQYGFKPKKRRKPLTVEKNLLRVAKGKRTRELRGTKGKRQKAALKFTGDASVVITPDGVSHVTDVTPSPVAQPVAVVSSPAPPLAAEAPSQPPLAAQPPSEPKPSTPPPPSAPPPSSTPPTSALPSSESPPPSVLTMPGASVESPSPAAPPPAPPPT